MRTLEKLHRTFECKKFVLSSLLYRDYYHYSLFVAKLCNIRCDKMFPLLYNIFFFFVGFKREARKAIWAPAAEKARDSHCFDRWTKVFLSRANGSWWNRRHWFYIGIHVPMGLAQDYRYTRQILRRLNIYSTFTLNTEHSKDEVDWRGGGITRVIFDIPNGWLIYSRLLIICETIRLDLTTFFFALSSIIQCPMNFEFGAILSMWLINERAI